MRKTSYMLNELHISSECQKTVKQAMPYIQRNGPFTCTNTLSAHILKCFVACINNIQQKKF